MFQDKCLVQFEIVNVPNEALRVKGSSGNRHGLIHAHTHTHRVKKEFRNGNNKLHGSNTF